MKLTEVQIENGIYEAIRLGIVAAGYLPDAVNYLNDNQGYINAIEAIKSSGKKPIYIENSGSYKAHERLEENCIIVEKEDAQPSQTGTKSVPEYVFNEENNNYDKTVTAEGLFDLQYRISVVCYDTSYLEIMEGIILQKLRFRHIIDAMDNDANVTGRFKVWRRNYIQLDSNKFMERAIMFDIPSVDLIGNTGDTVIARAEEISIGISSNKDIAIDGTDDIVVTIP